MKNLFPPVPFRVCAARIAIATALVSAVIPDSLAQSFTSIATSRERFTKNKKKTGSTYFGSFGAPSINDRGNLAFYTTIYGRKVDRSTNSAICLLKGKKPKMVIQETNTVYTYDGDPYPLLKLTKAPKINQSNRIGVTAIIGAGGAGGGAPLFVGIATQKGAIRGFNGPASGTAELEQDSFDLNVKTRMSFLGELTDIDDDGNTGTFQTEFRLSAKRTQAVISQGETPIGFPLGTTFTGFGAPSIDAQDNLYYVANVSNTGAAYDGLWYGRTADGIPLVTVNDVSPEGQKYTSFQAPPIANDAGTICAFVAGTGSSTGTGLWLIDPRSLQVTTVVTAQTKVEGRSIQNLTAGGVNNNGTVAFYATWGPDTAIVSGKPSSLKVVIATGQTVTVDGVAKKVIDLRFDPLGGLNNSDQLAFTASFDDRSSGVFVVSVK